MPLEAGRPALEPSGSPVAISPDPKALLVKRVEVAVTLQDSSVDAAPGRARPRPLLPGSRSGVQRARSSLPRVHARPVHLLRCQTGGAAQKGAALVLMVRRR